MLLCDLPKHFLFITSFILCITKCTVMARVTPGAQAEGKHLKGKSCASVIRTSSRENEACLSSVPCVQGLQVWVGLSLQTYTRQDCPEQGAACPHNPDVAKGECGHRETHIAHCDQLPSQTQSPTGGQLPAS